MGAATVLSHKCVLPHNCSLVLPLNAVRFSHLCFWWSGSCPLPCFWGGSKVLFFLGSVCAINFRVRTFVLLSFYVLVFLVGICQCFSRIFLQFRPGNAFKKFSACQVLFFCLVLSVLRSGLTTLLLLFFSPFFSEERQLKANRPPHTPPHVLLFCLFLFLSPPRWFVRLFWPCVLFVLGFLRGAILGPVFFLDSLRTLLRPFSWTRGGRGVCSFLFVVCCFSRFAAPHVSRRPPRHSMPQGARQQVVSPAPWGSAPQVQCASRAEGLRPPPVWFIFVANSCFGSQGPKSLFVRWGDCCVAPTLSHARFFPPGLSLSLFLFLSLSLSLFLSLSLCLIGFPFAHIAMYTHKCKK